MLWFHFPAYFFAGAFFANFVPHFVSGVLGRTFPTPFASPPFRGQSPPRVNVLYGMGNLAVAYALLLHVGDFEPRSRSRRPLRARVREALHINRPRALGPREPTRARRAPRHAAREPSRERRGLPRFCRGELVRQLTPHRSRGASGFASRGSGFGVRGSEGARWGRR